MDNARFRSRSGRGALRALGLGALATLCLDPTVQAETATRPVTFTRDIAPIFQEKCQVCHRPE